MAVIGFRKFNGEVPKAPAHLLPETGAQEAQKCSFTKGLLTPLKGGLTPPGWSSSINPIQSLYTEDGIRFFVWPYEVWPMKSPVIDEVYNRVYWIDKSLTPARFSVSTMAADLIAPWTIPGNKVFAGVPAPTVAPVLSLVDLVELPDYSGAAFTFEAWWEADGTKYGYVALPNQVSTVTKWKQYSFPTAAVPLPGDAPEGAKLTVQITLWHDSKTIFRLSATTAENPTRTSAVPGGVEMTFTVSAGSNTGVIDLSWGIVETRAYVYTVTNLWNEESAPSPAALVSVSYIQKVRVTTTAVDFTGYRPMGTTYIYRTFGSSANYVRATYTTVSALVFDDTTTSSNMSSIGLVTQGWSTPPTALVAAVMMPNGWIAGFKGNQLYMSEPYRPHTWPYSMTFQHNITGLCVGAQGLVVTTYGGCYIVTGVHPSSVTQMKLPVPYAGISQRSMTNVNGAVAFACADGVVLVRGSAASLEPSNKYFDRETWRSRYATHLSAMSFGFHDGQLVAMTSNAEVGFQFNTDEGEGSTFTQNPLQGRAVTYVPQLDELYYANGATVYSYGAGALLAPLWKSKDFILASPASFSCGFVRMRANTTVYAYIYADGVLQYATPALSETGYFRLPTKGKFARWSIELTITGTTAVVEEFTIASSMGELKGV